jgi:hypothetical protein
MKLCYWVCGSQHFEDPVFLLNIWNHLSNHTVTYPRRPESSWSMMTHCLTLTAVFKSSTRRVGHWARRWPRGVDTTCTCTTLITAIISDGGDRNRWNVGHETLIAHNPHGSFQSYTLYDTTTWLWAGALVICNYWRYRPVTSPEYEMLYNVCF